MKNTSGAEAKPREGSEGADASPAPALRADAARNRRRVVDAACEVFGARGLDAPLEEVASAAGVGIATLYRRFPTREDLIAAVFQSMFSAYRTVLDEAAGDPDPWKGLQRLINGLCELQASNSALTDLVPMRFPKSPQTDRLQVATQAKLEDLLTRCREAGMLRPDAELTDLILIFVGNAAIVRRTGECAPEVWRRYVALQLDALRAERTGEQLPPAPAVAQIVAALKCSKR